MKNTRTWFTGIATVAIVAAAAAGYGVGAQAADAPAPAKQVSRPDTAAVYPDVVETSHASKGAADFLRSFFTAKSQHKVDATASHFNKQQAAYYDATLGWPAESYDAVRKIFADAMPNWPKEAKSYPTRIIGDTRSAVVLFTDTPELFGGEVRAIGVLDFENGKITRWVDYWDSRNFGSEAAAKLRTPAAAFPQSLGENKVSGHASAAVDRAARKLNDALSRKDAKAAAALFSDDATFEDMALRTNIQGRSAIGRYLQRALPDLPYGPGATVRHVVGSNQGGGYEWKADGKAVPRGATALELDAQGKITRLTAVWDGSLLSDQVMSSLAARSID
ncbi:nuclear transport factor 2 family protein [Cryptosporangium phraense]|uniref:Nuclear transport factor 2 family protein n=1 Tax=Cryptosporangium phraense TaxID=2593070 RepID=A0A545AUU3_9ACTN|nr:nuclear transport factor 2 family protein [Cryptosporangium phraense]TQS45110.1 nuclear transport factor 2 family protein [Cryptosporangium phraense]